MLAHHPARAAVARTRPRTSRRRTRGSILPVRIQRRFTRPVGRLDGMAGALHVGVVLNAEKPGLSPRTKRQRCGSSNWVLSRRRHRVTDSSAIRLGLRPKFAQQEAGLPTNSKREASARRLASKRAIWERVSAPTLSSAD